METTTPKYLANHGEIMQQERKTKVVVFMAIMVMTLIVAVPSQAMMGGGGGGSSSSGSMMGNMGGMMGNMGGMMGNMGGMMGGQGATQRNPQNNNGAMVVTTPSQAEALVRERIARNPNVKTGAALERDTDFTVDVLSNDGAVIDQMIVDKRSGTIRSIYQ